MKTNPFEEFCGTLYKVKDNNTLRVIKVGSGQPLVILSNEIVMILDINFTINKNWDISLDSKDSNKHWINFTFLYKTIVCRTTIDYLKFKWDLYVKNKGTGEGSDKETIKLLIDTNFSPVEE